MNKVAFVAALLIAAAPALAGVTPQISSLSDTTLDRSGRLVILGSGFGAAQGSGSVRIDGLDAIVTQWASAEIHAYVPEAAMVGTVPVQVVTPGGARATW